MLFGAARIRATMYGADCLVHLLNHQGRQLRENVGANMRDCWICSLLPRRPRAEEQLHSADHTGQII